MKLDIDKYSKKYKFIFFIQEFTKRYFEHGISKSAAALTYYFTFSIFPFFIFLTMLIGYMDISPEMIIEVFSKFIPSDIIEIINSFIKHITSIRNTKIMFFGAFFSIYFNMRAINFIMECINTAYHINQKRNPLVHKIIVFIIAITFIFSIIIALILLIVGENLLTFVSNIFEFSNPYIDTWNTLRFIILAGLLFTILSLLYYITPMKKLPRKYVFIGTIFSLSSWLIISIGFSYYVENIASYSVIYGSIGAMIVLLMWLYFSSLVIILGAEFIHSLITTKEYFNK